MNSKLKKAGVLGAGLMGTAIARHMAGNGLEVCLVDNNADQLEKAASTTDGFAIECTTDMSVLADVDYLIEAVFEDLDVKHEALAAATAITPDNCIIATNTSSLLVSDLAGAVRLPNNFIGVHYNNPADINPIVEVIATAHSDTGCIDTLYHWLKSAGKQAVKCADTSGFILNRQSLPYINEAARCADSATPCQIDRIATEQLGVGLGPFAVMNLVGLPVMAASSRNLAVLGGGYAAADALQNKAASGNPVWEITGPDSLEDSQAANIAARLTGAMLFPGMDILENKLCTRDDLHLICIEALGYRTSSAELVEKLSPKEAARLIDTYLSHQ